MMRKIYFFIFGIAFVTNANQKLEKPDLTKVQERQETAQVIGDLSQSGINRLVGEHLKEANQKRAEADRIEKNDQAKAETLRNEAKVIEAEYGVGSSLQMGIRAATGALQGVATGNTNQAIVGGLSPYANKAVKEATTNADGTVNKEANLIAHAVLGSVEAKATGNNVLAGVTSALTAEASAPYLMQAIYGTDKAENLSDSQKQNIANLSQVVAGLSGGLAGDSTGSVVAGAEIGKRAVENNGLLDVQVKDLFKDLEKAEREGRPLEEVFAKAKKLSDEQLKDVQENCKSALCRYGVEKNNEEANQKALELVGFFNSRLSTLSASAQEKFIEFVIEENAKEINFINGARSPIEKVAVLLVDAFVEDRENRGLKVSPKISGFAQKTRGEQLKINKKAGDDFENEIFNIRKSKGAEVQQQITIKTKSGVKTRIDIVSKENGKTVCIECKSSKTAPLTKNQSKAFPEIEKTGGVVVGKGKEGFPGGTIIEPTKVIIERK